MTTTTIEESKLLYSLNIADSQGTIIDSIKVYKLHCDQQKLFAISSNEDGFLITKPQNTEVFEEAMLMLYISGLTYVKEKLIV